MDTGVQKRQLIGSYRDLHVYKMAMDGAIRLFELTKLFPSEEKFSLVDQIRRCSRSVCANIAEAWRKRRYERGGLRQQAERRRDGSRRDTGVSRDGLSLWILG